MLLLWLNVVWMLMVSLVGSGLYVIVLRLWCRWVGLVVLMMVLVVLLWKVMKCRVMLV